MLLKRRFSEKRVFVLLSMFLLLAVELLFAGCSEKDEGQGSKGDSTKIERSTKSSEDEDDDEDADDDEDEDEDESSNDWDDVLDSYEEIINDQIDILKKVKAGDSMAGLKQVENLKKIEDLAKKLGSAGSSMSASQLKRFTELQQKYAKALTQ